MEKVHYFTGENYNNVEFAVRSQVPVACNCNSSYSGGWDWENHGSRPADAKIFETLSQQEKLDVVMCSCFLSYYKKHK
jgi:hypothetical protein